MTGLASNGGTCCRSRRFDAIPVPVSRAAHEHQCSDVLGVSVLEFLARADVRPLPGFGSCRVLACTRCIKAGKVVKAA